MNMRIKKTNLNFFGFSVFAVMCVCLNFLFFSKTNTTYFNSDSISNFDELPLEDQVTEELSQFSTEELKQALINHF
jgi:hypothetical protein